MEISKPVMKKHPSHFPPEQTLMQFNSVDSRFGKGLYGGLWGKLSWRVSEQITDLRDKDHT